VGRFAGKGSDKAEEVEIGFESGKPVSVNGKKLGPIELLEYADEIARSMA